MKRSGQAQIVYAKNVNCNIPITWRWARRDDRKKETTRRTWRSEAKEQEQEREEGGGGEEEEELSTDLFLQATSGWDTAADCDLRGIRAIDDNLRVDEVDAALLDLNGLDLVVLVVDVFQSNSSPLERGRVLLPQEVLICETITFLIIAVSNKLADVLSPVNYKGLYQGWTQTSIYLQVIHSTSHYTTSLPVLVFFVCFVLFCFSLSNHSSISIHNFGRQTQKNKNTCFEAWSRSVVNAWSC